MSIRRYEASDAEALAALYVRSVEQVGPRRYSPRQVAAWASRGPSPERIHERAADGRTTLVAVDDRDRPIAFGDLETDGHIDFLYCAPEAVGKGVASALCDELEKIARACGVRRLYTEASEVARPLFSRKGFVVTSRRELEIAGAAIHNYAMEKRLA